MSTQSQSDFATLLDDLMEAARQREASEAPGTPTLRHDLLEQLERLQKDNKVASVRSVAEEFEAYAADNDVAGNDAPAAEAPVDRPVTPTIAPALDDLFFLDPGSIARELGIRKARTRDELDKARRTFAMRYHPDRVPEDMRERAKMRMQIANMLIDEAKRTTR